MASLIFRQASYTRWAEMSRLTSILAVAFSRDLGIEAGEPKSNRARPLNKAPPEVTGARSSLWRQSVLSKANRPPDP